MYILVNEDSDVIDEYTNYETAQKEAKEYVEEHEQSVCIYKMVAKATQVVKTRVELQFIK